MTNPDAEAVDPLVVYKMHLGTAGFRLSGHPMMLLELEAAPLSAAVLGPVTPETMQFVLDRTRAREIALAILEAADEE